MNLFSQSLVIGFAIFISSSAVAEERHPAVLDRFAMVEEGFYRGGRPTTEAHAAFLKKYHIKTIINVSDDLEAQAVEKALAEKQGMNVIYFPMHGWKSPKDWQTEQVLAMLNDPSLRPIYIHCKHGRERTGVMVGLYRVFTNGWTPRQAYKEMKQMGFRTIAWNFRKYFKRKSGYYDNPDGIPTAPLLADAEGY